MMRTHIVLASALMFGVAGAVISSAKADDQSLLVPLRLDDGVVTLPVPGNGSISLSVEASTNSTALIFRLDGNSESMTPYLLDLNGFPFDIAGAAPAFGATVISITGPDMTLSVHPVSNVFTTQFAMQLNGGVQVGMGINLLRTRGMAAPFETFELQNVTFQIDAGAVNTDLTLADGTTRSQGINLKNAAKLTLGDNTAVTGPITALRETTVSLPGGLSSTLGDHASAMKLLGNVSVGEGAVLTLRPPTDASVQTATTSVAGTFVVTGGTVQVQSETGAASRFLSGTEQAAIAAKSLAAGLGATYPGLAASEAARSAHAANVVGLEKQFVQLAVELAELKAQVTPVEALIVQLLAEMEAVRNQEQAELEAQQQATEQNQAILSALQAAADQRREAQEAASSLGSTVSADVVEFVGSLSVRDGEIGHLAIEGDLLMNATSTLVIDVAGIDPSLHDTIDVAGGATFAIGSLLNVQLLDTYVPALFDDFPLLTADQIDLQGLLLSTPPLSDGFFATSVFDNVDGTQTLHLLVLPSSLVPEPAGLLLAGHCVWIFCLARTRRSRAAGMLSGTNGTFLAQRLTTNA